MNGFLYIDKPENCTSRDVVNQICKIYQMKKVGHTGTLDPMATGVLVIALGEGTKLIEELTAKEKEYIASVQLGIKTDTLDMTGTVIKEEEVPSLSKEEIETVLASFEGTIEQEVPYYSAVRVNGRRLYDYARKKEEVELPKRTVEIKEIKLLDQTKKTFTFSVKVSKGTYIRSLIRDIGEKLQVSCTMKSLRRTKQGTISIEECIPLDQITKETKLISLDSVLKEYPSYVLKEELVKPVRNGARIPNVAYTSKVRLYNKEGHLLALYEVDPKDSSQLKARKMFHEVENEEIK